MCPVPNTTCRRGSVIRAMGRREPAADTSRSDVGAWLAPEDGVSVRNRCEIGCASVTIDWDMGASARHLFDIPLDDRRTLGCGNLNEPAGSPSSPAQDHAAV